MVVTTVSMDSSIMVASNTDSSRVVVTTVSMDSSSNMVASNTDSSTVVELLPPTTRIMVSTKDPTKTANTVLQVLLLTSLEISRILSLST